MYFIAKFSFTMVDTHRLMHVKETRKYEHNNTICSVLKFTVFVA